jgi:hypothetical protein
MRPRLIGGLRLTLRVQSVGKQAPGVRGSGLQLHGAAQRGECPGSAAGLAPGDPEFQVRSGRMRLLQGQRFQNFESGLRPAAAPVRSAEYQAGVRMARIHTEYFARLLRGELGIFLEQTRRVSQRNVDRPNRL